MSKYHERLQGLFHQFEAKHSRQPATTREAVAWAVANGFLPPPIRIDPLDRLAEEMAQALQEEYRTDKYGRRYRVNHAVRTTEQGVQTTLWADMDYAPRPHMEKAFAQRRKQVVGDLVQLKKDIDVYNDSRQEDPPIQIVLNFTDDVEEQMLWTGKGSAA